MLLFLSFLSLLIIFLYFSILFPNQKRNFQSLIFSPNSYGADESKKSDLPFPVDIVYTWVNGNDPIWIKKKNKFTNVKIPIQTEKGRFGDNNELKFSLRAIYQNIKWVNKIFIVTDQQIPSWLNTRHPKIKIVDHSEIIPEYSLPTFNSNNIEFHLHKINNLSEHFIYLNDDVFISQKLNASFFFSIDHIYREDKRNKLNDSNTHQNNSQINLEKGEKSNIESSKKNLRNNGLTDVEIKGKPIVPAVMNKEKYLNYFYKYSIIDNDMGTRQYHQILINTYQKFYALFPDKDINYGTAHVYLPLTKDIMRNIWSYFEQQLVEMESHHFRDHTDFNLATMSILIGQYFNKSICFDSYPKIKFIGVDYGIYRKLNNFIPETYASFCLNSGETSGATPKKFIQEFLKKIYPNKSPYEK